MKRIRIIQPVLLAVVLGGGFAMVALIAISILRLMAVATFMNEGYETANYVTESATFLEGGTPVIQVTNKLGNSENLRSLKGDVFKPGSGKISRQVARLTRATYNDPFVRFDRIRLFEICDNTAWYMVVSDEDNRSAYLVGYSGKTKMPIGYCGSNGFTPELPPKDSHFHLRSLSKQNDAFTGIKAITKPPTGTYGNVRLLLCEDRLFEISIPTQTLRVVPNIKSPLSGGVMVSENGNRTVISTKDQVIIFSDDDKKEDRYTLPPDLQKSNVFTLCLDKLKDGELIALTERGLKVQYISFDKSGKVSKKEDALLKTTLPKASNQESRAKIAIVSAAINSVGVTACILTAGVYRESKAGRSLKKFFNNIMKDSSAEMWALIIPMFIVALLAAALCYRRQRKYAQPWTWAWMLFVFLGGLPAMVGYLFHRRWPVLEACPACGKRVPRDREHCAACGKPFPLPEKTGAEVFA